MSGGTLERRRTLGDSVVMNPPAPVIHVYPSYGNTLTAYSASGDRRADKSSSGRSVSSVSTTVTNEDYDWWDAGLTTQELVDMTNYDSIQCTAEAPSGYMNLVWCFIHCPNTIGADLEVNVTYHLTNGTTYAENLGAVTTASRFISLDIDNCFENLGGASQPNDGFPNLDTANLDYITVSAYAFKNNLFSPETLFNIYLDSNPSISVKAPTFYPEAGTYPSTVYVSIMQDSTVPGLTTYYLMSDEPTEPTMQNATPYIDGRQISISSTCYLCAKSFVTMGSGTVVSSQTTYGLYTITNSSTVLNPPVFTPVPGVYSVAQSVEIVNPNNNPNNTQTIYYNMNGSTPDLHSNQYTYPIPVSDTTTISAAVYDSATGVWSDVETGTYTISAQYNTNEVTYVFNSDGTTCCGLYQLAKKSDTGNSIENYGFSISGTNKSTVAYFTLDGTTPTTSSQQLSNGQWYSLYKPNTVLVKYRAVAPNCADILGEFWVRINKCAALYRYSGNKFVIGSSYCNWLNRDLSNYSQDNCVYIYLNGNQLFPDNFSIESEDVLGTNAGLITYTPSQGTSIDSSFLFIYGYSAPSQGNGYNYCPFNLMKELEGGMRSLYLGIKNNVFNRRTGAEAIYVSVNELSTLRVSGQMHLNDLNFSGLQSPIVRPCDSRTSLEQLTVACTNLERIDLSPCSSLVRLDNYSLAHTYNNTDTETGLTSVIMPPRISSLGDGILEKSGSEYSTTRRPVTVEFFNPTVPQITSNTFGDYPNGAGGSIPIGSDSTIVVNYEPSHADVCSYENAWHYHQTRSGGTSSTGGNLTNMKIVDQDGLECGEIPGDIPTVTTGTAASITASSAVVNSNNVTADGGNQIQRRGVCWSTNPSPNIFSQHTDATTATTGAFNISLGNSLERNTTYYYRAYATNEKGIAYGETKNFTTLNVIVEPTVASGPYDSGTSSNCTVVNREHISGWKVLDDGGSNVMRMAIVYSTTDANPTNDDNLIYTSYSWTDSSGILHFSGSVDFSGYPEGTTIYIRGAAQNQAGLWGYADFVHEFTVPPSNNIVNPSVDIGGVQYEYSSGEHVIGGLIYPYSVTLNCNVNLGTYGNVIVQFLYAENQIPEQGSGNTVVADAIQSPVNSSSNCTYRIGLSELEAMQPGARYYVKARCRQASDSQWIYSEYYTYFDNTYQIGNAHTISATANSSDSVTVRCRYDVLHPSGSYQNNYERYGAAIYDQDPFQEGVEPMNVIDYYNSTNDFVYDKTIDILFTGLDESTTYYVRACYTYTNEHIEYGGTLNVTTPSITRNCLSVKPGDALSSRRTSANVNLSFDRWWQLTFTYSWGYDNTLGDLILENQWDYLGDKLGNKTDDYGDNRDLFGWGCTSQPHRSNKYEAWSMGGTDSDYRAYDVSNSGLTNSSYNGQANWGWQSERCYNSHLFQATDYIYSGTGIFTPKSKGRGGNSQTGYGPNDIVYGDVTAQNWSRPLTSGEMSYLLYTRSTVTGKKFCKARIDKGDGVYTNGLILLYDNWNDGISLNGANDATANYTSNTITENQWYTYFSDRAAFLPAAGYTRGDGNVLYANSVGCYWLNDSYSSTHAYCLVFRSNSLDVGIQNKRFRCSVRLFEVW